MTYQSKRRPEDDCRICIHESGHALASRILGSPLGGVTAQAGDGLSGLCWGPEYFTRFAENVDDEPELCEKLVGLMPRIGEPRSVIADITQHCHTMIVELRAGTVAERLFLPGEPWFAADDRRQEIGLASLVASSPPTVDAFIAFCDAEAEAMLRLNEHILRALAEALRIRRTLTGTEVDEVIATAVSERAAEAERQRRLDWKRAEQSAAWFQAACRAH
jgi:hypothetical protein